MKKMVASIVTLICVAAVIVGISLVTLPTAMTLEPFVAPAPSGAVWAVENRQYVPCIYTVNVDNKVIDIYRTEHMSGGYQAVTSMGSDGEQLYYTRQAADAKGNPQGGWSAWKYDSVTQQTTELTEQSGAGAVKGVAIWQNSLWVTAQENDGAIVVYKLPVEGGVQQEVERLWLPEGKHLLQASYTAIGKLTVLLDSGETILLPSGKLEESTAAYQYGHSIDELTIDNSVSLKLYLPPIFITFFIVMVLFALPVPLVMLYCKANKLLHRIFAVGALGVLATYLITMSMLLMQIVGVNGRANLNASFAVAGQVANIIGQQNPTLLPAAGTTEEQNFRSFLGAKDELLAVQDGTAVVAVSNSKPMGTVPNYDKKTAAMVEQAMQGTNGGDYFTFSGRHVVVSACGIYSRNQLVGVLVTRSGLDNLDKGQATPLLWLAAAAMLVLLLLTLLLHRMLAKVTNPIGRMTKKMEEISAGDLTLWQTGDTHDELDGMSRAMQEMCMSLAIRDYEVDCTISSYNRFVPRGIDKLLESASVQEVIAGDMHAITGTVGLMWVSNRDTARAGLSDDQFAHFINSCCATISKNLAEYDGHLLTSSFDLSASRIFFNGADNKAVTAALALTDRSKQAVDEMMQPHFSILLHYTKLLYGIAGGQEQLFPFVSSAELEFLQLYTEHFCHAGVRLVLTEKLVEALGGSTQVRYIGFVASDDEQCSFKLYEALNVYSDTQYNLRMRYDDRLQEGIQLFYRSDFYLARNIFSSLMRTAPDDGIIRWYLYACEYYFNCSDRDTIDYRLFGIDKAK